MVLASGRSKYQIKNEDHIITSAKTEYLGTKKTLLALSNLSL